MIANRYFETPFGCLLLLKLASYLYNVYLKPGSLVEIVPAKGKKENIIINKKGKIAPALEEGFCNILYDNNESEVGVPRDRIRPMPKEKVSTNQVLKVDESVINRCLSERIQTNSKFNISLHDFGGQSVFNLLHPLFMTRFGVYTLVFNMEDLLLPDDSEQYKRGIVSLKFWLNSIAIHTMSEVKDETIEGTTTSSRVIEKTAPVVIVGTRKDKVSNQSDHDKISDIIHKAFSGHIVFTSGSLLRNFNLTFFPVDNTLGRRDSTMKALMSAIEKEIDSSDYVHHEYPMSWLQAFDRLKALKRPFFTYAEVLEITRSFGIVDLEVPQMLLFLHDMGMLMFHEEEKLRDIVIMDPVSFFVSPATKVICDHEKTFAYGVERNHHLDIHRELEKRYPKEFNEMKKKGFVTNRLMQELLSECGENRSLVLRLMVKNGLVSRVLTKAVDDGNSSISSSSSNSSSSSSSSSSNCSSENNTPLQDAAGNKFDEWYLVPCLLPLCDTKNTNSSNMSIDITQKSPMNPWKNSFYFLFTSSNFLKSRKTISWGDIKSHGFLPQGLFERLICKAVNWSQVTQSEHSDISISHLFKDIASMRYGGQRFRLTCLTEYNCIKVDVEGEYSIAVYKRLYDQIKVLISECMKSLIAIPSLIYSPTSTSTSTSTEESTCHITVSEALKLVDGKIPDYVVESSDNQHIILCANMKAQHPGWFGNLGLLPMYDLFISHRWGVKEKGIGLHDDSLVESIYDRLTYYSIETNNRSINTFLDAQRLLTGRDFKFDFAKALIKSTVIVSIISKYASGRLVLGIHNSVGYQARSFGCRNI